MARRHKVWFLWLLLTLAVLLSAGCGRCHTQHNIISYHSAYTTQSCTCWGRDDKTGACTFETCTPVYHPATCSVSVYCDLRCKVLDKGRSEAHPEHPTLRLYPDEVDPRCTPHGTVR